MRQFTEDMWKTLESETYREYVTDEGKVYRIDNPAKMFVSKTGTHFVMDAEGVVHTFLKTSFMCLRFNDTKGLTFVEPSLAKAA